MIFKNLGNGRFTRMNGNGISLVDKTSVFKDRYGM
jgi:hypothetical protein